MSVTRVLCACVVGAMAVPAIATPTFVVSSYNAMVGSSTSAGPLTPTASTNDINTPLWSGGSAYSSVFFEPISNRITVSVGYVPAPTLFSTGRGGQVAMTFTPSSDATLTLGCENGSDGMTSNSAYLAEGPDILLFHIAYFGPTASIQVFAGHTYDLWLSSAVYSRDGATAYAELSDPVPAPTGAIVIGAAGVFASRRRRN